MWKKKNKRIDIDLRAPKRRRSFFEKKEERVPSRDFSRIIFRFVLLVFLGAVAYILFFSTFLEIKKVDLIGIAELNYDNVYGKINELLADKIFNIIPENNFILVPSGKIRSALQDNFKKISAVKIGKIFPDRIRVEITERKALLIWCSAGPCYIVDENGYAYTWTDLESDDVRQNNLLSIIDNSGKPITIGEKVLSEGYIKFIIALKDELESETGIEITDEYQTGSRMAEEARVKTEDGWEIFFSTSLPMEDSIRTLKTFLEKEMADKDKSKLEYIDLRAENKVYYKIRTDDNSQNNTEDLQNNTENKQSAVDAEKKDDKKKKK